MTQIEIIAILAPALAGSVGLNLYLWWKFTANLDRIYHELAEAMDAKYTRELFHDPDVFFVNVDELVNDLGADQKAVYALRDKRIERIRREEAI